MAALLLKVQVSDTCILPHGATLVFLLYNEQILLHNGGMIVAKINSFD